MRKEYNFLSKYYDILHNEKDYSEEASFFTELINKYKQNKGDKLLDAACGTGSHIFYFKNKFETEGIDLSKNLIDLAREKNKGIKFEVADITKFKSLKKFDIITCLFSSIAYLKNTESVKKTLNNFHNNLNKGGILLIETIFLKDTLKNIKDHVRQYSDEKLKIKRIINIFINSNLAKVNAKYEILEKGKSKRNITDKQIVKLLTKLELKALIEKRGFQVKIFDYKKTGTLLFLCIKN